MNEIKQIHLGRQPFTISVDAHRELRAYLEAIERQAGSKSEVVKEVELRMAELLLERGLKGEKVVLPEDVAFLKEQLGEPRDFKDESSDDEPVPGSKDEAPKRLYRDTQNGMIAGVSSGIAAYFGIDPTIVRLIFIVALFAGGSAIPIYLILWLVTPEAKTPSDRLQMQGKAVTVDSLKEFVDRADVKGAADRAGRTVGPILEGVVQYIGGTIGAFLALIAVVLFMSLSAAVTYLFIHRNDAVAQLIPFPVGSNETLFTAMCAVVTVIIGLFLLLIGVAMMRRKWAVPGWVTASLIGVMLVTGAVGAAVGPDAVYSVRDRFEAAQRVDAKKVEAFDSVYLKGDNISYTLEKSDKYEVGVRYVGSNKPGMPQITLVDGQLVIDARELRHDCSGLCISSGEFYELVIRAPKEVKITSEGDVSPVYDLDDGLPNKLQTN
ncbi:MAG TPA: PspC domain-containing protein [Candidatus Saccharimonadales bacterium]|nr:PspC domain-containing protein [Candidatus Saccharimonadales bacterium]